METVRRILKSSANSKNAVMGAIRIVKVVASNDAAGRRVNVSPAADKLLTARIVEGDAQFCNPEATTMYGKELKSGAWYVTQSCVIELEAKYDIKTLRCSTMTDDYAFSLSEVEYCNDLNEIYLNKCEGDLKYLANKPLTKIELNSTNVYGDIGALSGNTNITTFKLKNTKTYGDISALGEMTSLISVDVSYTSIGGRIEDFVARQREAGRTVCDGIEVFLNPNITYKETPCISKVRYLSWDENTITL